MSKVTVTCIICEQKFEVNLSAAQSKLLTNDSKGKSVLPLITDKRKQNENMLSDISVEHRLLLTSNMCVKCYNSLEEDDED